MLQSRYLLRLQVGQALERHGSIQMPIGRFVDTPGSSTSDDCRYVISAGKCFQNRLFNSLNNLSPAVELVAAFLAAANVRLCALALIAAKNPLGEGALGLRHGHRLSATPTKRLG